MLPARVCPECRSPMEGADCTSCSFSDRSLQNTYSQRSLGASEISVDIFVLIDRTGSGGAFSRGVTQSCRLILDTVQKNVARLSITVQTHGDEDYQEMPCVLVSHQPVSATLRAIGNIHYEGGGDGPETHLSAVEQMLMNLSKTRHRDRRTRQAMLLFANDESKPARSGRTPTQIGQAIREAGILFYLISQPTQNLLEMKKAAGGMFYEITNYPSPELMLYIATQISKSVVHSVSVGSPFPVELAAEDLPKQLPRPSLIKRLSFFGSKGHD